MSHQSHVLLGQLLKRHGYSFTKQREAVFSALESHEGPLSMQELLHQCSPAVDRATLYRIIKSFEQAGIVQRVNIGWKYRLELTDRFQHHHHHMTCTHCGAMIALAEDDIEQLLHAVAERYDFKASQHQLEIQGICRSCRSTS